MAEIRDYETLVTGDENNSGMRPLIVRVLEEAKGSLIRVEIRSTPQGIPTSTVEHNVSIDSSVTNDESVMQALIARLNESPGEQFNGAVRINFYRSGTSDKLGTYTRHVKCGLMSEPIGQMSHWQNQPSHAGMPPLSLDDEPNFESHHNAGDDHMPRSSRGGPPMDPNEMPMGDDSPNMRNLMMPPMSGGGGNTGIVTDQQARAWIELYASLNFRQQAQMIVMFERTIRFLENFTMRFGAPEAPRNGGIQDMPAPAPRSQQPEGLGLLPMLVNAAAQLAAASQGGPEAAAKEAVKLATGEPPKQGAARAMAVRGATDLVRRFGSTPGVGNSTPRRPAPPVEPMLDTMFEPPDDDPLGGPGGNSGMTFDPSDPNPPFDDGAAGFDSDQATAEVQERAAAFDPNALSADQMKEMVVNWIRTDPSRKNEVMGMVPELMKEVT